MSNLKCLALFGAIALLATACTDQNAPEPEPAAVPTAPAPSAAAAPAASMPQLTAAQLSEKRFNSKASCNIEAVNGIQFGSDPVKVTRKKIIVGGWYLPEFSKKTGSPAALRVVDEAGTTGWEVNAEHWSPRENVLAVMHAVDTGNAGFRETLDLSSLAPGKYKLSLVFADSGKNYVCDHSRMLDVQ